MPRIASSVLGLMISSLMIGSALAQGSPSSELEQVGLTPPTLLSQGYQATGEEAMVTSLLGSPVFASAEPDGVLLGTISDLVIGPLGTVAAAVLTLDAAAPGRRVAVDFSQIQRVSTPDGGIRMTLDITPDNLMAAPEFVAPMAPTSPATPQTPADQAAQLQPGDPNAAPVDPSLTTDQPQQAASQQQPAPQADLVQPPIDALLGLPVYGRNDQPIGTITALLETPEGAIEGLVVDVGGFLGLGAKSVAIAYENLTFGTDTMGGSYLYLNTTREALEAQPVFDPATFELERDTQLMRVPQ